MIGSASSLQEEYAAVGEVLVAAANELRSPLRELVHSQIGAAAPFIRAAVVLAAGLGQPDSTELRARRIHLAAALEMLAIAHRTHKLILQVETDALDRSLLGSTILAGDFCFSRSAVLAAATDDPRVVEIFAESLKTLSEGNLRTVFGGSAPFDEDGALCGSGVVAAVHLARLSSDWVGPLTAAAQHLLAWLACGADGAPILITDALPAHQRLRWQGVPNLLRAAGEDGPL